METNFCPGCGTEHHWLACPEVSQSVFESEDPETAHEELTELADELETVDDAMLRGQMLHRFFELVAFIEAEQACREAPLVAAVERKVRRWESSWREVFQLAVGPPWDPRTPE